MSDSSSVLGGSVSLIGQVLAWNVVPPLLSQVLLKFLFASNLISPPKTAEQAQSYARRARIAVIVLYLTYSLVKRVQDLPPTHYATLGVPSWASEEEIKKRYRMLARIYHPDKIESLPDSGSVQDRFIQIRQATEILSDSVKRAAYDRFGPAVASWKQQITMREHMKTGLRDTFVFYVVHQLMQWTVSYFYGNQQAIFWRNLLALTALSIEIRLLISPASLALWSPLALLLPWQLGAVTRYTVVLLLRHLFTSSTLAIQQIGAQFPKDLTELTGAEKQKAEIELNKVMLQQSESIAALSGALQQHGRELLQQELQPFRIAAKEGPATLPEAAREAAIAHAQHNIGTSASTQTATSSKMESDCLHLVSDEILKIRLSTMPEVQRSLLQIRSQKADADARASAERKAEAEPPSGAEQKQPEAKSADEKRSSSTSSFEQIDDAGKSASNGQSNQDQEGARAAEKHTGVPALTTAETAPVQRSEFS